MNILLVEDNEGDIELTEWAFKKAGLTAALTVAHDGVEALEYLAQQGQLNNPMPDLVLLDLNMPRMNGLQFLEIVKKDNALKSIPIIILTSSNAPKDIQGCYAAHANCYILKLSNPIKFAGKMKQVEDFWINLAQLPEKLIVA